MKQIDPVTAANLRRAIAATFSPDPFLDTPDPRTVSAVARLVEGLASVSERRRPDRSNEPWSKETAQNQLEHACVHLDTAFHSVVEGDRAVGLDHETGLPHLLHAALRIAFAFALHERSCHTCNCHHVPNVACVQGCCPCDPCSAFSMWEPRT